MGRQHKEILGARSGHDLLEQGCCSGQQDGGSKEWKPPFREGEGERTLQKGHVPLSHTTRPTTPEEATEVWGVGWVA